MTRRILLLLLFLPVAAHAQAPQYVEREQNIHPPGSGQQGLDVLEVYADRPGRHPLVVLTHGSSPDPAKHATVTPWAQLPQALWFAQRGYVAIVVVRSGYGRSGGVQDVSYGGCKPGDYITPGRHAAADLRAVMHYAQTLPEVDGSTMISVGVSTGGYAQVALSADPPPGLKTAISFAGGRGGDDHEDICNLPALLQAFAAFGKDAQAHGGLPMLWIYAANDHFFDPAAAAQFRAAYTGSGGQVQFVAAPAFRDDGHYLFEAVTPWSDAVAAYLREHDLLPLGDTVLPGPQLPPLAAPPGLSDSGQQGWQRFLLAGPYSAFARGTTGGWDYAAGQFTQQMADEKALEGCSKHVQPPKSCQIVARTPVPPPAVKP